MTPFILFGLVIVFWPISVALTIVFLFLLWVSIVYQVLFAFRRRKESKKFQLEPEVMVIEADRNTKSAEDIKTS